MPAYRAGRFHEVLCSYLDRVAAGEIRRLMVFAPPQHGKSEIVSRRFPAYMLGRDPDLKIIGASYAWSLASGINRDVQRVIDSSAYRALFPGTRLYGKSVRSSAEGRFLKNADEFEVVDRRGSYRAAGVGMGIVGKPADLLVIDDPVAGAEQAYSPTYRNKLWEWYTSEAMTRLSPDARVVLMHQRWHEDDLAGRLLKKAKDDPRADQWTVVRFPALAYPDTARGNALRCPEDRRRPGEPLWPEQFDRDFLLARKATQSPQQYAAIYDQDPQPLEGAHFREQWFKRWLDTGGAWRLDGSRVVPQNGAEVFAIVDPNASERATSDLAAAAVFATTRTNDLLVLEVIRGRWGVEGIVPQVLALCQRWRCRWVGIEANGFQVGIAREARRTQGMPPVVELNPSSRSKLVRATDAIHRAAAGQVFLPESASWVPAFVEECVRFTGREGDEDGQVDCLAYAAWKQTNKIGTGDPGRPYVARP